MAHTLEELQAKKVAELREIAKDLDHDAVRGYSSMPKAQLVGAITTALGLGAETAEAAPAGGEPAAPKASRAAKTPAPKPADTDRRSLKLTIRELKTERNAALEAHDHVRLKLARRRIRHLKRRLRATPA